MEGCVGEEPGQLGEFGGGAELGRHGGPGVGGIAEAVEEDEDGGAR